MILVGSPQNWHAFQHDSESGSPGSEYLTPRINEQQKRPNSTRSLLRLVFSRPSILLFNLGSFDQLDVAYSTKTPKQARKPEPCSRLLQRHTKSNSLLVGAHKMCPLAAALREGWLVAIACLVGCRRVFDEPFALFEIQNAAVRLFSVGPPTIFISHRHDIQIKPSYI